MLSVVLEVNQMRTNIKNEMMSTKDIANRMVRLTKYLEDHYFNLGKLYAKRSEFKLGTDEREDVTVEIRDLEGKISDNKIALKEWYRLFGWTPTNTYNL